VGQSQKKHSRTHTHPDRQTSFINFCHLLRSIASSLFNLCAWQSFFIASLQVLFDLSFGLDASTLHVIHFFTQLSFFRNICPYHRSLFCCSTKSMSSVTNLSLSLLLGNLSVSLMPHIHLTILISARWSTTSHFYRAMLCIRGTSRRPVSVSVRVCVSVTSRSSTKTAKRKITQTTPHDSTGTLVFWCQRSP